MPNDQHEDQLQDNLLDSAILMLGSEDGLDANFDPSLNAIVSDDSGYANFNMDDLLAPVVPGVVDDAAMGSSEVDKDEDDSDSNDPAADAFFSDLSSLDGDDFFLSKPPLASFEKPDSSMMISESGLDGLDSDLGMSTAVEVIGGVDTYSGDFVDPPSLDNDISSEILEQELRVAAASFVDNGGAADVLRDFSEPDPEPDPEQASASQPAMAPVLDFDPFFASDLPESVLADDSSVSLGEELPPGVQIDSFNPEPDLPDMRIAQENIAEPERIHSQPETSGLPDIALALAAADHSDNIYKDPINNYQEGLSTDFDLDASLGVIGENNAPDADLYHQKLAQQEANIQPLQTVDSSLFLHTHGEPDNRKEPKLDSAANVDQIDFSAQPVAGSETQSENNHKRPREMKSHFVLVASIFAAVSLSVLSTWWWSTKSPQAEQNQAEIASVRSEMNKLSKHLQTLEDMTKNGDGVTLLSAYETLSQKQQQLNKEQANLLSMIKSQQAESVQFENDMISRLEQVVNYTKSVSDRQSLSETALRSELAQTVVMEVSAKTAGIDRVKIEQMSAELQQAKQKMLQMDKDVKAQAALVSLLEGETEYVQEQIKKQRAQSSLSGAPSQVSVRATERNEMKAETAPFSAAMSDYVVIGVLNSGENGFEIYLQPREAANTSSFETYYFKPGEQTPVPGYGNILNVQDTGSDEYAVPYQVVTEKGVIRGRKR